ncbi:malate/lactate/ureidoglycolate dehydrogenase [Variovorax humicola]|uniref:Malate/lactate/ureidoglycolate dehydrogenase n=1 Tax=Variovorax humicola TaxID=1769758 RepID=A0ABU8W1Q4_9BURK
MPQTLAAPLLRAQCASILVAAGSAPAEAQQVADNLVLANLSGHDSHGVGMLPRYVDAIAEGGLTPNAGIQVNVDIGTMLAIDGQHGFGQIVGVQAMELGIARAKQHGSCIFTLASAHHLGRIGHFAEMATAQGLVSMHFVNVLSRPNVAPWGGGDGRFGTNPCCIGIPLAGAEPFLLDFATSRVAQGKMRVAHNKGERVPDGYLIDERGMPTNDPGVVVVPQGKGLFGALMTFGEHKGYGMAVACELLGGALTGGGTWHRPADAARTVLNGMLTVLIDPAKLGTQAAFAQEANAFVDWLRQSPPAAGVDHVLIAGEPERAARVARERDGIWLDDATWGEIVASGAKVGVTVKAA